MALREIRVDRLGEEGVKTVKELERRMDSPTLE